MGSLEKLVGLVLLLPALFTSIVVIVLGASRWVDPVTRKETRKISPKELWGVVRLGGWRNAFPVIVAIFVAMISWLTGTPSMSGLALLANPTQTEASPAVAPPPTPTSVYHVDLHTATPVPSDTPSPTSTWEPTRTPNPPSYKEENSPTPRRVSPTPSPALPTQGNCPQSGLDVTSPKQGEHVSCKSGLTVYGSIDFDRIRNNYQWYEVQYAVTADDNPNVDYGVPIPFFGHKAECDSQAYANDHQEECSEKSYSRYYLLSIGKSKEYLATLTAGKLPCPPSGSWVVALWLKAGRNVFGPPAHEEVTRCFVRIYVDAQP